MDATASKADPKVLPRVARYLEQLPQGLDSYPQCRATAALYRQMIDLRPLDKLPPGALPASLQKLLATKVPVGGWLEDVKVMSVSLAIADAYKMTDEAFLEWNRELNRQFLGGRFFQVLMSLATPNLLFAGASIRWNAVRQGTQLTAHKVSANENQVTLTYPPRLYNELILRCFGTGFDAVLELSHAKSPHVQLVDFDEQTAQFRVSWQ